MDGERVDNKGLGDHPGLQSNPGGGTDSVEWRADVASLMLGHVKTSR
jgi:hypothetical protein